MPAWFGFQFFINNKGVTEGSNYLNFTVKKFKKGVDNNIYML
jgi:hypothetical protein